MVGLSREGLLNLSITKMKKSLYFAIAVLFTATTACLKVEPLSVEHIGGHNTSTSAESEAYYENLRQYKKQAENYGRPVAFGWFSNWAPTGVMRQGYLSSIPDSMDIVSMWSGAPGRYEITPAQKADKEFVQKVKGTKLLEVLLFSHIGKARTPESIYAEIERKAAEEGWSASKLALERKYARWDFWGFTSHDVNNKENLHVAMANYAKAIADSLVVSEWDGFDIDWEPGNGFNDDDGTITADPIFMVRELSKYLGPKSDKGDGKGHKLLCIDGNYSTFSPVSDCIDYWIKQAYGSANPGFSTPDNKPEKLIICSNFEASWKTGDAILKQAAAMPPTGYKGGVGAYRFNNDYANTPDYKYMRKAIQINQQVFNEWKAKQSTEEE